MMDDGVELLVLGELRKFLEESAAPLVIGLGSVRLVAHPFFSF